MSLLMVKYLKNKTTVVQKQLFIKSLMSFKNYNNNAIHQNYPKF